MSAILFANIEELQPYMSNMMQDTRLESLESFINAAQAEVELITGTEVMADLILAYNDDTMSAAQEELLPVVRKALVPMAFYKHSMKGSLLITDSAYSTEEGQNTKRPYQWQMRNFQKQCLADYAAGMNALWLYLLDNVADFADWEASPEYIYLQQRPINLLSEWGKAGRRIANWRTHYALLPEMNMVWEDLAVEISQELVDEINDGLLNGLSTLNEDLLPYIQRYVAHATVERAALTLPVSIDADGLLLNEVAPATQNSDVVKQESDRAGLQRQASEEASRALCRLKKFLDTNANEDDYVGYYTKFLENPTDEPTLNNDGDKLIFM
jgi:hypothetical protein